MAAATIAGLTARSSWTMEPGSNERAFRSARRHSRVVRILRTVLPVLIVAVTAGITVTVYLNRLLAPLPVKVDHLVVSGSKITMDHPHMTGFTRDERAYELRADAAIQDISKPNMIELKSIDAKVQMQDRSTMRLKAPNGIYDSKNETLKLDHNILMTSTSGYQGRLKQAMVDIRKGHVQSDQPVEMKMLQGTLNANRMEIINSGDFIRFDRGVRMVVMLNKSETKQKGAPGDANRHLGETVAANDAGKNAVRTVMTRLPRPDPRRVALFASAPKNLENLVWLRLPPQDPRRFDQLVTGSIR
jgi:lipopolysaccharide export system protein LptC